jgi:hypothetical protein
MHAMKQIKVYSILLKLVLSTNQSIQLVVLVTDLEWNVKQWQKNDFNMSVFFRFVKMRYIVLVNSHWHIRGAHI